MLEGGGGGEGVLGEGERRRSSLVLRWLLVLVTGTGYWYHGTWQLDGYYGIGKGEEEEEGVLCKQCLREG